MYFRCPVSGIKVWLLKSQFKHPVETAEFVLVIWLLYAVCLLYHRTKWKRRYAKWIRSRPRVHRKARRLFKLDPKQTLFSVTGQKVFRTDKTQ